MEYDLEIRSLFEICLDVIGCTFNSINKKCVKDLPKEILKHILCRLSPFNLEIIENEGFLNMRGISTEKLWKSHFKKRFYCGVTGVKTAECSNVEPLFGKSWRSQYFERHFHSLIYKNALSPHMERLFQLDDTHESFYHTSHCELCEKTPILGLSNEIEFCLKHLNGRIRLLNSTCVFLSQNKEITMKLTPILECVEVNRVRDDGVEYLIILLENLMKNKLKSFLLSNVNLLKVENLTALLKTLSKSQSLETQDLSVDYYNNSQDKEAGPALKKYKKLGTKTSLTSELKYLKYSDVKMVDNQDFCIHPEKEMINDDLYSDLDHSGGHLIRPSQEEGEAKDVNNFCATNDDLYEDIFSKCATSPKGYCMEKSLTSDTRTYSSPMMLDSWQRKRKLELNQPRANCLSVLELSDIHIYKASLNVLSKQLTFFHNLRSLTLCHITVEEMTVGDDPIINSLFQSIKELAIHGSLRNLHLEHPLRMQHLETICDMLISSCEKCHSTQVAKGLTSLHLSGHSGGMLIKNMNRLGEVLRTCSFCEIQVRACNMDEGIWFKTKDDGILHSVCRSDVPCSKHHQYIINGITSLYLSFRCEDKPAALVLASSLLRNRSLKNLSLPGCVLSTEDMSNIFDCISGSTFHECNTSITKLDLQENIFEITRSNSLFSLLTKSHLVYLNLSFCSLEVIPDNIVLALSSNKFLEVLKIAGNRLGDAGLNQLSKVFTSDRKTSVLNTLDLSCNCLTSSSLLNFGNVLLTWPEKLREISIKANTRANCIIVQECLEKVFDVVLMDCILLPENVDFSNRTDYLSEM